MNKGDEITKINLYLDGELPPEETTQLFYSIADNPVLQEEFRQALDLKDLLKQDLIAPPPYLKEQLLTKLNFKKTAFFGSLSLAIIAFLRRYLMNPVVGGIVFGGLMFLIGYFLSPIPESNVASNNITKNQMTQNSNIPTVSSTAPEIANNNINHNAVIITNKSRNKSIARTLKTENQTQNIIKDSRSINNFDNNYVSLPGTVYSTQMNTPKSTNLIFDNSSYIKNKPHPDDFYNFLENVSINFNKNFLNPNLKSNLEPLSNPMLNNFSLSVAYSIDPNNSLAIEYGQENFTQKYSGKIDGNPAKIMQVYTSQYAGVAYYHYFPHIFSIYKANPYTKIFGGLTQVGGIGKFEVGLNYNLNEKMAIRAGLETSMLLYKFQNQMFNSANYGLTTGMTISFR